MWFVHCLYRVLDGKSHQEKIGFDVGDDLHDFLSDSDVDTDLLHREGDSSGLYHSSVVRVALIFEPFNTESIMLDITVPIWP
jgi:hypothetical protein